MRKDVQDAWEEAPEFKDIRYPGKGPGPERIEEILSDNESVLCILKCIHTEKRGKIASKTLKCTAVITNQNIRLIREGTFTKDLSAAHESIPFHTITGIEKVRQLGMGTVVTITRAGNNDKLMMCDERQAQKFVSFIQEAISSKSSAATQSQIVHQVVNPLDQIKKLKELLDSGILTQEEFELKKRKLLDDI